MDPAISSPQVSNPNIVQQASDLPPQPIKKSKLPIVLLFLGILGTIFLSLPAIFILGVSLFQELQLGERYRPSYGDYAKVIIIFLPYIIIPLSQIVYAFILDKKQKMGVLNARQEKIAIALIALGIISVIIYIVWILFAPQPITINDPYGPW